MKNRAFKKWLVINFKSQDEMASTILHLLTEQHSMCFELMEEAEAPFTPNGYKKAAQFVIDEVKNEVDT